MNATPGATGGLDILAILKKLPHRYPFLLVDRVLACEPGSRIVALKNVTINEPFFQGHFPEFPVMPGVLIIEAMAQAAALLCMQTLPPERTRGSLFYFVGIDNARFKRPVVPGDTLTLEASIDGRFVRNIGRFKASAKCDGQIVSEADLMCAVKPIDEPGAGA
jgi:3-hydroxyacyl-[acyl-carrier-protein] dehydratase